MANISNDLSIALYDFWNSFGVPAYPNEIPLPDSTTPRKFPCIVYNLNKNQTLTNSNDYVRIFDEGERYYTEIYNIADKIDEEIKYGKVIPVGENSNIVIYQINWEYTPDTETTVSLYGDFTISYNM